MSTDCKYCKPGIAPPGMLWVAQHAAGTVLLVEDANHPGRCVVASSAHVRELFELSYGQRDAFMALVSAVAKTVAVAARADKINVGFYGDLSNHLHAHVVPKWQAGHGWGDAFLLQPRAPLHLANGPFDGWPATEIAAQLRDALSSAP